MMDSPGLLGKNGHRNHNCGIQSSAGHGPGGGGPEKEGEGEGDQVSNFLWLIKSHFPAYFSKLIC